MTPIRVQVLSDLHAEIDPGWLPSVAACHTGANLIIIAGDLARAPDAAATARTMFPSSPHLVLVAGNHEHYGTGLTIDDGNAAFKASAASLSRESKRIHALENDVATVLIGSTSVRILGCTLWTDYALFGPPEAGMRACAGAMADHRLIWGQNGMSVRPGELRRRHTRSRQFLADALAVQSNGPTIVVTHHLPSLRSVSTRWRTDPVSAGFASALDDLAALGPTLWVHGHTHDSAAWRDEHSGMLCVCNPAGYARPSGRRENPEFRPGLTVLITKESGVWRATPDQAG